MRKSKACGGTKLILTSAEIVFQPVVWNASISRFRLTIPLGTTNSLIPCSVEKPAVAEQWRALGPSSTGGPPDGH